MGWESVRRAQYVTITGGTGMGIVAHTPVPKNTQRRVLAWNIVTDEAVGTTRTHLYFRSIPAGTGATSAVFSVNAWPGGTRSCLPRPLTLGPEEFLTAQVLLLGGANSLLTEMLYIDMEVGEPIWIE